MIYGKIGVAEAPFVIAALFVILFIAVALFIPKTTKLIGNNLSAELNEVAEE